MRIKFNGREPDIEFSTSLDSFKSVSRDESDIWIVNGFTTKEGIKIHENDGLFRIERNTLPPEDALGAVMRARHTPKPHDKLKDRYVVVCGLGGLDSHIAVDLAGSGVGYLKLIDFDVVEPNNLNHQAYRVGGLGEFKTGVLKEQISEINPYIKTEICILKIDEKGLPGLSKDMGIICEALDGTLAKATIVRNLHRFYENITLICTSGFAGYGDSNSIQTRKITKNFYVCGGLVNSAETGSGLTAPYVNICAEHQSNLVLEPLADKE